MGALPRELRKSLEETVIAARRVAEAAAKAALGALAVNQDRAFDTMTDEDRRLRRALRAKSRQLGGLDALESETAYEQWHRMLFARFLAESGLLMHPEAGVPVSLSEVAELAHDEGEHDVWVLAGQYAARILPAVFQTSDPTLKLRFAPEGRLRLEALLQELPPVVFTSDDGLGWVYQFWQSEKKKQVNDSGEKIGASQLPAVTQLFTDDYMVRFLLENSLGAWWATLHPTSPLIKRFAYLRLDANGTPIAGRFESWPRRVRDVSVMDPCCGSGHFLTVAFEMLAAMRVEEEGFSATEAGDAVIRENLFGLEIDPRCTQIAAFSLALAAWRLGGYRQLPSPNVACSGIQVTGQLADWKKLAGDDSTLQSALERLHEQFRKAPELGSLIDPQRATEDGRLFAVDYDAIAPLLEQLLSREEDPEMLVAGWAAAGLTRAASMLARQYTLVATNVPYLSVQRMEPSLASFVTLRYPSARADLATCFIDRCLALASEGTVALVTLQGWVFLKSYGQFRRALLASAGWNLLTALGPGAFSGISGHVVQVVLTILMGPGAVRPSSVGLINAMSARGPEQKAGQIRELPVMGVPQAVLTANPDAIFAVAARGDRIGHVAQFADSWQGLVTRDIARYTVHFWEVSERSTIWERFLTAPQSTGELTGRDTYLRWEKGKGSLVRDGGAHNFNPPKVLGKNGVLVAEGTLCATLYLGEMFNQASVPLVVRDEKYLLPLWAYCRSDQFRSDVRLINQKVVVGAGYFARLPFDLDRWSKVAKELYPQGPPEPYSVDPTQWLFKGDPTVATEPLQVAVARLLGYRWPDQQDDPLHEFVDPDGVIAIAPVPGEELAVARLRALMERAWGGHWSQSVLNGLLAPTQSPNDLEGWLRDHFFTAHVKTFSNRPFIWHIWDGRRDGFAVLVNYHRLTRTLLSRITHTLLGAWIELQRDQIRSKLPGSEGRLAAAEDLQRKLNLIAEGEPPHDIYVRWKPVADQPIGWDPDLNDGVRMNIRPFVVAGVLRSRVNIDWKKDRGKNPNGSERINDVHLARAEKAAARQPKSA